MEQSAQQTVQEKLLRIISGHTQCNGNIALMHQGRSLSLDLYNGVRVKIAEATEIKDGKRYPMVLADFFAALERASTVFEIIDAKRVNADAKDLPKEAKRTFAEQRAHDAEIDAENAERWSRRTLDGKVGTISFSLNWLASGMSESFEGYLLETKEDSLRFRLANVSEW